MAKRRKKRRSKKCSGSSSIFFTNAVLIIALLLCVFSATPYGKDALEKFGIEAGNFYGDTGTQDKNDNDMDKTPENLRTDNNGKLKFDFIDVGQGDSILVTTPNGKRILVDTGTRDTADELCDFLGKGGAKTLDYLVLSHPHSDHIGGAERVLESFSVKNVIMPNAVNTGSTFERTITAIQKEKQEGCKVYSAIPGDDYTVDGCRVNILGPCLEDEENLNNMSIIMTIEYRDFKALFTGDAEKDAEKATLDRGYNVDCDLYKVGHHGSSTSSSDELLSAASPAVAVISCGKDNSYGHPHAAVTKALKDRKIDSYITSKRGNITVVTDGKTYSITAEK